jgi:hypothetical protein
MDGAVLSKLLGRTVVASVISANYGANKQMAISF